MISVIQILLQRKCACAEAHKSLRPHFGGQSIIDLPTTTKFSQISPVIFNVKAVSCMTATAEGLVSSCIRSIQS